VPMQRCHLLPRWLFVPVIADPLRLRAVWRPKSTWRQGSFVLIERQVAGKAMILDGTGRAIESL
jgi:hypothetical protein